MKKIKSIRVTKEEVMKIKYNAVFPSTEINILLLAAGKWFGSSDIEPFIELLDKNHCQYEVRFTDSNEEEV